jgi:hypothetical protein
LSQVDCTLGIEWCFTLKNLPSIDNRGISVAEVPQHKSPRRTVKKDFNVQSGYRGMVQHDIASRRIATEAHGAWIFAGLLVANGLSFCLMPFLPL